MSYYWFNRQKILQTAKEKYSKEKAAKYYLQNKEAIKKKQKNVTETCHKKKRPNWRVPEKEISGIGSI